MFILSYKACKRLKADQQHDGLGASSMINRGKMLMKAALAARCSEQCLFSHTHHTHGSHSWPRAELAHLKG